MILKNITPNRIRILIRTLFFAVTWCYCWLFYGDVFYQMQENSLWFFATPSEYADLLIPLDYLTYISRFCLSLFAIKWLGALVIATILLLIEIFVDNILRFKIDLFAISYIPSIIILFILSSQDFTIFSRTENSYIFKILLLTLSVAIILSLISRLILSNRKESEPKWIWIAVNLAFIAVLIFSAGIYAKRNPEFNRIASIKYCISNQKWSKAARIAEESSAPIRSTAAYHLIALSQMGQVGSRTFNMSHDYLNGDISTSLNRIIYGSSLYSPEMQFYVGLATTSYHFLTEQMAINGKYKCYLKLTVKTAIVNDETELADKILRIIDRIPFEGKFVKRFRRMIDNPELIMKDPEIASVVELSPKFNIFEQVIEPPLVINYYSRLSHIKGLSARSQDLVLAACLYTKNLDAFAANCSVLRNRQIVPKNFQEALAMMASGTGDNNYITKYHVSKDVENQVNQFYKQLELHMTDKDQGKEALKKQFGKTYMYYIYFQNQRS